MDAIFEDSSEEVGAEVEAYCPSPRCKADTTHTIISMYDGEIRRVQCSVCGDVHAYRKPRGDILEEPEMTKVTPVKRMSWDEAFARTTDADLMTCRPYSIRDAYERGDVVLHPTFDVGFVVELLPDNKADVAFKDHGSKILVHNRGDLATRMPDISEVTQPREVKKKKRNKKQEIDDVAPIARTSAEAAASLQLARDAANGRLDEQADRGSKPKLERPSKPDIKVAKELTASEARKPVPSKSAGKPSGAAKRDANSAPKADTKPAKADKAPAKAKATGKPVKVAKPTKAAPAAKVPAKSAAKPVKSSAKPSKPAPKPTKTAAKPTAKAVKASKPSPKAKPVDKKASAKAAKKPAKPVKAKKR